MEAHRVSIPKRLVVFVLDDSENKFCILDPKENKLIKLNEKDATHIESLKKPHETINMFLNTDLPFITYHDLNLFDVFDEDLEKFPLRFYKYSDAILERDVEIPNDLGMKKRPSIPDDGLSPRSSLPSRDALRSKTSLMVKLKMLRDSSPRVKVRHFAYHNFESDERLTIRNIVASFFFMTPEESTADVEALDIINQRVVDEWTSFQKCTTPILGQHQRKRMKHSPFVYRTHTGLSFTKQHVDLEKSLLRFIAIGTTWSCQTLLVDLKKLYQDKSYLSGLNFKGKKEVLLSVYDEYYQDPSLSMVMRHLKNTSLKHGSTKLVSNAQDVFNNWLSNVEAYLRLKPLQGDILARMVDYGYLEDKKHNGQDTHLKCDGYYIVYEPLCAEWEDLEPIDINNDEHFELAKQALKRIHQLGVTFAPSTSLTKDILKVYGGKVRVVNLEAVNTTGVSQYYMNKDNMMLEREFKRANASSSSTSKKVSYPAGMIYGDELSDDEGDEDDGDEDDDSVLSSSEILY
ncbi:hypothetical protein BON22_3329 [Cyberlindnera fabianii]|uniref:Uncharacterized protein n=1 Tax=Cyberlindnera fabianii TaxID=36022 RepID=A0A1V2L4B7_CYBFA|nr:hypothetical protein BON22_3329 [Cyberlindnera fabianii]